MQTTGVTSHYLQARLRNILQEEDIRSRCSEPPYLLKDISSQEALKDTVHILRLFWEKIRGTFMPQRNDFCQELVQARSTSTRLGETTEYYYNERRENNVDIGIFYQDT